MAAASPSPHAPTPARLLGPHPALWGATMSQRCRNVDSRPPMASDLDLTAV